MHGEHLHRTHRCRLLEERKGKICNLNHKYVSIGNHDQGENKRAYI